MKYIKDRNELKQIFKNQTTINPKYNKTKYIEWLENVVITNENNEFLNDMFKNELKNKNYNLWLELSKNYHNFLVLKGKATN